VQLNLGGDRPGQLAYSRVLAIRDFRYVPYWTSDASFASSTALAR
jgi:hypothetical protein